MPLAVGDIAPPFEALTQTGEEVSLARYKGRKVILYFYPKDNTPGCTRQACNLRDAHAKLRKQGYVILGVSQDSVASHKRFAEKYALPFPLLADTDGKISEAYGTARKLFWPRRTTFVIDEEGRIAQIITDVKTGTHAEQILGDSASHNTPCREGG